MPKIRQLFSEKFPNAEILSHMKPEEVICIGAAKEAAIIQGKEEIDFADLSCPVDCLAKNISLEVCLVLAHFIVGFVLNCMTDL